MLVRRLDSLSHVLASQMLAHFFFPLCLFFCLSSLFFLQLSLPSVCNRPRSALFLVEKDFLRELVCLNS